MRNLSHDVCEQLNGRVNACSFFLLALGKSADIYDVANKGFYNRIISISKNLLAMDKKQRFRLVPFLSFINGESRTVSVVKRRKMMGASDVISLVSSQSVPSPRGLKHRHRLEEECSCYFFAALRINSSLFQME